MHTLPPSLGLESRRRLDIARRLAEAHLEIGDASLLGFVSGSVVEDLADALSDVDMSLVFATLPDPSALQAACRRAGGGDWFWQQGDVAQGMVVALHVGGVEVQIGYSDQPTLASHLDALLLRHDPDTPHHKLAEGIAKAWPLVGESRLAALQARLAAFPPELALAMVRHGLAAPMPWRIAAGLLQRDAALWCRELVVEACWQLLLVLCGLNRRYFNRFQSKRLHRLARGLALAPPQLADRIEALLLAPPGQAFRLLFALEGEVLDLVAQALPQVDLSAVRRRREAWA